jgi:hypothetical protein
MIAIDLPQIGQHRHAVVGQCVVFSLCEAKNDTQYH